MIGNISSCGGMRRGSRTSLARVLCLAVLPLCMSLPCPLVFQLLVEEMAPTRWGGGGLEDSDQM